VLTVPAALAGRRGFPAELPEGRAHASCKVALRPQPGVKSRAIQPQHGSSASSRIMRSLAISDLKKSMIGFAKIPRTEMSGVVFLAREA
jgi:hypothetical protein